MEKTYRRGSVEVRATSRPIKIAFLVPYNESQNSQWILDAVFYDSYTRWGGAHTIIVPVNEADFLYPQSEQWLTSFDPDYIYSYLKVSNALTERLIELCNPISIIKHQVQDATRWQEFLPTWAHHFEAVPSLSTLFSPYASNRRYGDGSEQNKIVLTQLVDIPNERFLADNFGTAHDNSVYTNPVSGLFETLCFSKKAERGSVKGGTEETESLTDILRRLNTGSITTFATLSRIHSTGLTKVSPHAWSDSFSVFVGESCLDRIHFWNARNLSPSWFESPSAIIVKPSLLADDGFAAALVEYINKFNFLRSGGGQPSVSIRSFSVELPALENARAKIKNKCFSNVELDAQKFNIFVFPSEEDLRRPWKKHSDTKTFRISEEENTVDADRPAHFRYMPPRFDGINKGNWAIELDIERQNSHSKYSNVTDRWRLPRSPTVSRAFSQRPSRVDRNGLLVLLPKSDDGGPLFSREGMRNYWYDLVSPSDELVFRHLAIRSRRIDQDDLRSEIQTSGYDDIRISDKGENLRGIISMFPRFSESYKILTNGIWRNILRDFSESVTVSKSEMFGRVPNDIGFKRHVAKVFGLKNLGQSVSYLAANFDDTLEYLVERQIFFQVHRWRCQYCGHINIRTLDELKKENECGICRLTHFSPIDPTWEFRSNSFVADSLCIRHGLPVLWTLGYLHKVYDGRKLLFSAGS